MASKASLRFFNNDALILIAKQKNDEAFTNIVKRIIKVRYEEMDLDLCDLCKIINQKNDLEFQIISEVIIDKSRYVDGIISTNIADKVVLSLNLNYLMIACKESQNDYIKRKSIERMNELFEKIESIPDIKDELLEKINMDNKENNKVRRMIKW